MAPLTRKGVVERDGMCSIRAGGEGRQRGPPVRLRRAASTGEIPGMCTDATLNDRLDDLVLAG
jgi:hypothetical protein